MQKKNYKIFISVNKYLMLTVTVVIAILGIAFFEIKNNLNFNVSTQISSIEANPSVNAVGSVLEFEDLTIPYLRSREYKSKLDTLQQVYEQDSFSGNLTSYNSDGLKINGLLTLPKGEMPVGGWPAVVFIHGYIPPDQYQTLSRYTDYVDYIAQKGFVVFKIDLRGHGESEGQPSGAYYSSDYVIDTLNAYAALQSANFINPKKIGIWAHSMAGNVSLRAVAVKTEVPALVIWAGAGFSYVDLQEYGISDASYRPQPSDTERIRKRLRIRQLYGDPKDGNPFWLQVAPTNFLKDLKGAIQLDHALDDETVSIEYSRNLNRLLDQTQVAHQFNEYPSGGHNLKGESWVQAMQNTVLFYKKYLNNE